MFSLICFDRSRPSPHPSIHFFSTAHPLCHTTLFFHPSICSSHYNYCNTCAHLYQSLTSLPQPRLIHPFSVSIPSSLLLSIYPDSLTWFLLFLQLKNGGEIKLEPLSASLVRSVAAVTSQASVTTVPIVPASSGICDDDGLRPGKSTAIPYIPAQQQASSTTSSHQERALRYFTMTQSGDPGHPEPELNSSPLLPESGERAGAPLPPTSSAGHRQQGEVEEEGRRERQEEEVRGRQKGGAREESQDGRIKGKPHSPDRDRDGRQRQQHPQPQHSAEPSSRRGESEPLPSWRAADGDSQESRERAEGGERGRGGYLREAAHSSSTQEQERSSGRSLAGISGRRLLWWLTQKRGGEESGKE